MTSDKIKDKTEMILNGSATHIPFPTKLPSTLTKNGNHQRDRGTLRTASGWVLNSFDTCSTCIRINSFLVIEMLWMWNRIVLCS